MGYNDSERKPTGEEMTKKPLNGWVKASLWFSASSVGLISYLSERQWLISVTSSWFVGVFEGACLIIGFFNIADRYGSSIAEICQGLKEIGQQRAKKKPPKRLMSCNSDCGSNV